MLNRFIKYFHWISQISLSFKKTKVLLNYLYGNTMESEAASKIQNVNMNVNKTFKGGEEQL